MRAVAKLLLLSIVTGLCVLGWGAQPGNGGVAAADAQPTIRVTRVYSGDDGQSHADEAELKLSTPNALGMEQSEARKAASINFVRFPPNFFEDWHGAHARRYVITLTGRGEAEIGGGQKVPMEPGRVVLFEDMTGKGHISRALTADWTAVFIQLDPK
jgi:hypothetical protein